MARPDDTNPLNTNKPPAQRPERSADDRSELQHEAWSVAGQPDDFSRQREGRSNAEGSERGQPEWQTQSPDNDSGQERWSTPKDLDNHAQPDPTAEVEDDEGPESPESHLRGDRQLAHQVLRGLRNQESVDARDIKVAVDGGRATLTGTVPLPEMKVLAGERAAETSGISSCRNDLEVVPRPVTQPIQI